MSIIEIFNRAAKAGNMFSESAAGFTISYITLINLTPQETAFLKHNESKLKMWKGFSPKGDKTWEVCEYDLRLDSPHTSWIQFFS